MALFSSFHDGETLGILERACLSSFIRHGHDFTLYSYRPLDVPEGVVLADARAIIPAAEYEAFFAQAPGRVSQFANGFRYAMLLAQGGWWVDTDVLCIDAAIPEAEIVIGWECLLRPDNTRWIGNAIMKLPAGHALAQRTYDRWRGMWSETRWGYSGPRNLTYSVADLDMNDAVLPFGSLYYTLWDETLVLFDPNTVEEAKKITQGASLLHLANSGLGIQGLTRNLLPPRGSFLRPHFVPALSAEEIATGDEAFTAALVKGFRALRGKK